MRKRILITFSGDRYHDTTKKIGEDSPKYGADEIFVYDDVWLKEKRPKHCAETKWAFDHPKCRGVNWFCFKPFIIQDVLNRRSDGDIVLFIDADTWPVTDMTPLFDVCERDGAMLFAACGHRQSQWSKRDTQILCGADDLYYRNKQAGVARFMLFKKGATVYDQERTKGSIGVEDFVKKWLEITYNPLANTFDKSVLAPEYDDDFIEARCEQAVLTNLAHLNGIPLHREADQWGNDFKADFPDDTYGQIFESTGVYSYDPHPFPGQKGSRFRNVHD